jgi:glycosyltransferase involved in cell wall biosynthesis
VAMSSFASLPDIIQDGENGFIVPNNDINAFAEKVCLLMDNQDLRENMAKKCMESVKKFSIENIVNEWEKLFKEIKKC